MISLTCCLDDMLCELQFCPFSDDVNSLEESGFYNLGHSSSI